MEYIVFLSLNNEKDRRSEVLDLFEFSAAGNPG